MNKTSWQWTREIKKDPVTIFVTSLENKVKKTSTDVKKLKNAQFRELSLEETIKTLRKAASNKSWTVQAFLFIRQS